MKKFVLVITVILSLISVSAYATKTPITENEKITNIINECYPDLKDYYEAGVLAVESLTEERLFDGSTEYDIKYRFVRSLYEEDEIVAVLKEKYPAVYKMNEIGLVKDVSVYKFVDEVTGEIINGIIFNRNEERFRIPRPGMWARK